MFLLFYWLAVVKQVLWCIVGKGVPTPRTKMQPHPALATPRLFSNLNPTDDFFHRIQNYWMYELYREAEELDQVDELADTPDWFK